MSPMPPICDPPQHLQPPDGPNCGTSQHVQLATAPGPGPAASGLRPFGPATSQTLSVGTPAYTARVAPYALTVAPYRWRIGPYSPRGPLPMRGSPLSCTVAPYRWRIAPYPPRGPRPMRGSPLSWLDSLLPLADRHGHYGALVLLGSPLPHGPLLPPGSPLTVDPCACQAASNHRPLS